jgi:hypothetical protein
MSKKINWKQKVRELVRDIGRAEARKLLESAGVSKVTADRLTGKTTRYPSNVGPLLGSAIERALESSKSKAS